jgi:hypothetical protein
MYFTNIIFFTSFFIPTGQMRFAVIGDSSRAGILATPYFPSNIAHGIACVVK